MTKPRVLVIDDEKNTREGLRKYFHDKYDMLLAESGEQGLEMLRHQAVDIGLSFIRQAAAMEDAPLIILFTAYGTLQIADAALQEGAYDYLTKPLNLNNLEMVIERGRETRRLRDENERLRQELDTRYGTENIIGTSSGMSAVFETVRQVAPARTTVLLTGESGTGKEVVAKAIHRMSPRADKPFVVVHCAALNPNLLESELFGHEKGAYTGAHERKIGRFEKADEGTLFLDEVGELDAAIQIKLLRVLESRTFERVGSAVPINVDVRLITATNRDLRQLVDCGQFREDLYYRLNVVNVHLPPLRQRTEDIPALLEHFLDMFAKENGKKINGFSAEAMKVLASYCWPGNVRELRNCVERMVVMARGSTLTLSDVPADIRGNVAHAATVDAAEAATESIPAAGTSLDLNAHERTLISRALQECSGNRTRAAERLGISRRTLHRKIKTYGLEDL
jgi:two-component system response regulator AtoC